MNDETYSSEVGEVREDEKADGDEVVQDHLEGVRARDFGPQQLVKIAAQLDVVVLHECTVCLYVCECKTCIRGFLSTVIYLNVYVLCINICT